MGRNWPEAKETLRYGIIEILFTFLSKMTDTYILYVICISLKFIYSCLGGGFKDF